MFPRSTFHFPVILAALVVSGMDPSWTIHSRMSMKTQPQTHMSLLFCLCSQSAVFPYLTGHDVSISYLHIYDLVPFPFSSLFLVSVLRRRDLLPRSYCWHQCNVCSRMQLYARWQEFLAAFWWRYYTDLFSSSCTLSEKESLKLSLFLPLAGLLTGGF